MFGLFKKRQPEPSPLPSRYPQFQSFFATEWVRSALVTSIAGFSGAVLCGDGTKVITKAWKKMWASNLPNEPMIPPEGLSVSQFTDSERLVVCITFPPPQAIGGAYFGVAVLGPCNDPEWGPDARQNLAYRYFVLLRAAHGTAVEEWTGDLPITLGNGPEPQQPFFAEWVLNHAVRATADTTVTICSGTDAIAVAIARSRQELPAILERFLAGELNDMGFTVKIPIKEGEITEHFWLSGTTYADGQFSGIIEADPQCVTTVKRGDPWTASMADVTDWMYARNQKMHGNYTLRALLPQMPPDQAAKYRAVFADEGGEQNVHGNPH